MAGGVSAEQLEQRLRVEFVDDARDRLDRLYQQLSAMKQAGGGGGEAIAVLTREAQNLRACGTAFGYPAVSLVAHRLENYLSGVDSVTEMQVGDLYVFVDRIAALVDRPTQPDLKETNEIVRKLPTRYVFDVSDVEIRDVEIMLVTPSRTVAKMVGTEMAACGYRPVTVHDPIESLRLAVRLPPAMIVASMVMDNLTGLDLLRAFRAITPTRSVPLALLTSLDAQNAALKDLPNGAVIVRTGAHFSDDFAAAVTRFDL